MSPTVLEASVKKERAPVPPLFPCPVVASAKPNVTGFELSKAVWDIPKEILPRLERSVLRALADYYGLPRICPCNETIADHIDVEPRSVSALTRLESAKWISVGISSDRKGDSRLRKDKAPIATRKGGRQLTTTWVLNVAGILQLAWGDEHENTGIASPVDGEKAEAASSLKSRKAEIASSFKQLNPEAAALKAEAVALNPEAASSEQSTSRVETNNNTTNAKTVTALCRRFSSKSGKPALLSKEKRELLTEFVADQDLAELEAAVTYYAENPPNHYNDKTTYWMNGFVDGFDACLKHGREQLDLDAKQREERAAKVERMLQVPKYKAKWESTPESEHEGLLKEYQDERNELCFANQKWENIALYSSEQSDRFRATLTADDQALLASLPRSNAVKPFSTLEAFCAAIKIRNTFEQRAREWNEQNPEPELFGEPF